MKLSEALFTLMSECVRIGVSFNLEFDNGKRIPGEFYDLSEEEKKKHIRQDPAGWTIEIAGNYYEKDGSEQLYPELTNAVSAGLYLLRDVMAEKGETSPQLEALVS